MKLQGFKVKTSGRIAITDVASAALAFSKSIPLTVCALTYKGHFQGVFSTRESLGNPDIVGRAFFEFLTVNVHKLR